MGIGIPFLVSIPPQAPLPFSGLPGGKWAALGTTVKLICVCIDKITVVHLGCSGIETNPCFCSRVSFLYTTTVRRLRA